jgi:hypothetical protein
VPQAGVDGVPGPGDRAGGQGSEAAVALGQTDDPVADLRHGWDLHVGFGVAHPAFYTLIYGEPRPGAESPAARAAAEVLGRQVHRIAEAGRLRVSEERAAHMIHSAGCGTTLTLIGIPEELRDPELSPLAREAVLAAVTTDAAEHGADDGGAPVGQALALGAALHRTTALTPAERTLLIEWLDRIATRG